MIDTNEYLDVVNTKNEVIRTAKKREVYSKKLNCRAVHVFLLHPRTLDVFIQKRSVGKEYYPLCYSTTACGHLNAGESYEQAARRELEEELGQDVSLRFGAELRLRFRGFWTFTQIWYGFAESGFKPNEEVDSGQFYTLEEAFKIARGPNAHPQLLPCLNWLKKERHTLLRRWAKTEHISGER